MASDLLCTLYNFALIFYVHIFIFNKFMNQCGKTHFFEGIACEFLWIQ